MKIPQMAAVIADYVKKYSGKSKADIEQQMNNNCKKNGITKNSGENEFSIPQFVCDVSNILKHFDGKGPVEIEEDLKTRDHLELEEIHIIVTRLSLAPDFD